MTSKLKCPFCGKELTEYPVWGFGCGNTNCACSEGVVGSEQLWQALIQAKQDLEKAKAGFLNIRSWCGVSGLSGYVPTICEQQIKAKKRE